MTFDARLNCWQKQLDIRVSKVEVTHNPIAIYRRGHLNLLCIHLCTAYQPRRKIIVYVAYARTAARSLKYIFIPYISMREFIRCCSLP
jgi:hypothetical protein